jgi:major membrane immunogen (membrane-anchored lipoprotein)
MKNKLLTKILVPLILFIALSCISKSIYKKDGVFVGRSRSRYTSEPFVATSRVYIEKGKIRKIDFSIKDTLNNELFDGTYERHFVGNNEYINQCRNDWSGIQEYPKELLKSQKMEYIDAVSGATWSYNMFVSSTEIALRMAKN